MYSKTHLACFSSEIHMLLSLSIPFSGEIVTISPGSTSLTKLAPIVSSAQVSEAQYIGPVPFSDTERPKSERISRTDQLSGRHDNEGIGTFDLFHGPSHRFFYCFGVQTFPCTVIGDHFRIDRRLKIAPVYSSSLRSSGALIRLPLWASPSVPFT